MHDFPRSFEIPPKDWWKCGTNNGLWVNWYLERKGFPEVNLAYKQEDGVPFTIDLLDFAKEVREYWKEQEGNS